MSNKSTTEREAAGMKARGNQLPQSKLTPETVRKIRENREGWTQKRWAEHLGVHINTVWRASKLENWGWVE